MTKFIIRKYEDLINTQYFPRPKMTEEWAEALAFWTEYPALPGERLFETIQRVSVEPSGVVNVITWEVDDHTRTVKIMYEVL
jgi:hypothetical protein